MAKHKLFNYFKTSPKTIHLAVMTYVRLPLSLGNVEGLLHQCGANLSHEIVSVWWHRFGPSFSAKIRKRQIKRRKASR
ncbi:hypothetical protein SAMN05421759_11454 [Roseivivax lentus]|uniref:Transposase n=1 Tax=Roseivivax lentus TaxID=633194 RepID=A0A1N7PBP3_9RHOB|nr:hypothetical protein SAMN05421759_11454 [Roseivivax lentus]